MWNQEKEVHAISECTGVAIESKPTIARLTKLEQVAQGITHNATAVIDR